MFVFLLKTGYYLGMKKETIVQEAVRIIRKYLTDEYEVLLFGSWAKGNANETSDLDIAILGKNEVDWNVMARILSEVDEIKTLRKIDIVDLNSVGAEFKKNVLKYAQAIV